MSKAQAEVIMTSEDLKSRVLTEFDSAALELQVEESQFRELPTFFEVAHLSMKLIVRDSTDCARATAVALTIKNELLARGVELDYTVEAKQAACAA